MSDAGGVELQLAAGESTDTDEKNTASSGGGGKSSSSSNSSTTSTSSENDDGEKSKSSSGEDEDEDEDCDDGEKEEQEKQGEQESKTPGAAEDGKGASAVQRVTVRHIILLSEMVLLTLSVLFVEVMLIPALPIIAKRYPDDRAWVSWVLSSYMITGAITTPIFAGLASRFGVRPMIAICLSGYLLGILGCAVSFLADTIAVLLLCRAIQGFGMGSFTMCFTLIKATFPPKLVSVSLGLVSSMFSAGAAIGLVGGGAALNGIHFEYKGFPVQWAVLFWIVGPIVFVLCVAFMFTIKEPKAVRGSKKYMVDFLGVILVAVAIAASLVGLTLGEQGWKKPAPITLLCVGPVTLILFVLWEFFRKEAALVNMRLMLGNLTILFVNVIALCAGYSMFSIFQVPLTPKCT
eukprot:TRINITY_DN771_c0_g1_i7.p1 TRINITY_DN771_c0_g1~~TRINITY_DN771_c0_g1_i7.p1  ORF type:complete len:405 (+),score=92.99 TRINITY_DN771_c0_g1_i7:217-1431(+)